MASTTSKTTKKRKTLGDSTPSQEARQKRLRKEAANEGEEVGKAFKDMAMAWRREIGLDNSRSFIIKVAVKFLYEGKWKEITHDALIDTGAECSVYDIGYVEKELLPWKKREHRLRILGADGRRLDKSGIAQVTGLTMKVYDSKGKSLRETDLTTEIMELNDAAHGCPLILGWDWLQKNVEKIAIDRPALEFYQPVEIQEVHDHSEWEEALEDSAWIGIVKVNSMGKSFWADIEVVEWDRLETLRVAHIQFTDAAGNSVADRLPPQYRQFAQLFSREAQQQLSEHGSEDMTIDLEPGKVPPAGHLYPLSKDELDLLKEYLDDMVRTGKIRPSKGSAGAPIFFAKHSSGKLRIVVDYRGLNAVTQKDKYPLPLMSQLMEQVSSAKYFTKLDLKNGFNLIRIAAGDEWKTAFRTRYGSYEYMVMPFGLTNAPAVFQRFINGILSDKVDRGVVVYIDDILIYIKAEEEHTALVTWVLQKLMDAGLCVNIDKCVFHVAEVEFVGYKIGRQGIEMSRDKVEHILDWARPRNVKEVQSFLGFANFYRRFIQGFSKICRPLTDLTKKGVLWEWTAPCQNAFETLKKAFTEAPILAHFWPDRAKMIETDASDLAKGGILSQHEPDKKWHPVAFYSKKFLPAEVNYDVHDKEMVVIVDCFKEWRHFLIGCPHKIMVYTDHKNLEYFNSTKVLNRRQARWAEILSEFDFVIVYRPGEKNGKADALSRRSDPELEGGSESHPEITFFKPGQLQVAEGEEVLLTRQVVIMAATKVDELKWHKDIMTAGKADPEWDRIRIALETGTLAHGTEDYMLEDGLVCFRRRVWIPADTALKIKVTFESHDSKVAGHFGRDKTLELMKRNYYWPNMEDWVRNYVKTCDACQRNKTSKHAKYGALKPLDIPYAPWLNISMDFIVELPESKGFNKIWVIVDRFSKMAHFIPLKKTTARELSVGFVKEIWRLHGLPKSIVSDRDSLFISHFWEALMKLLNVSLDKSTAYHPQTDGQTERVNQVLEHYLRSYCNWDQSDWVELLPFAEFCYNNTYHSAIKTTPFYAVYGRHPENNWPNAVVVTKTPAASERIEELLGMQNEMKVHLEAAQTRMAKYYDRHVATKEPQFKVGDWVMLRADNIKTKRQTKKLDHKLRDKFQISKLVGTRAYKLEFPPGTKLHAVVHISMLEPYHANNIPGRTESTPPPIDLEENIYEVESIHDSKILRKKVMYLVNWKGYGPDEDTWEPYSNLEGSEEAIRDFHRTHPNKPRDPQVQF